jgi:hypothetical protein
VLPGDSFSSALLRWDTVAPEVRAVLPRETPAAQEIERRVFRKGDLGREEISGWVAWPNGTVWQGTIETTLSPTPNGKWQRSGPPTGTGRVWNGAVMRRRTVEAATGSGPGGGGSTPPDDATALEVLPGELARMFPPDATGIVWRQVASHGAVTEVVEMLTPNGEGVLTLRAERRARREAELGRAEWRAVTVSTRDASRPWRYEPGGATRALGGGLRRALGRSAVPEVRN